MDDSNRHPHDTAVSMPGRRHALALPGGGSATLYHLPRQAPASVIEAPPLLVVHSVNATASAFEMQPIALRQARQRPVIALDLPGFGLSDKPDQRYSPQQMQQAVAAAMDWIDVEIGAGPIDVMALSLGCEFAAEAVLQKPQRVRTLTLISPTGMEGRRVGERYKQGQTREMTWMRRLLRETRVGGWLYRLLTRPGSIRWFLSRSWGTPGFDPRLLEHGLACAAQTGARFAPLDFVAGALFTRGIVERYRSVPVPMWVAHGTKGSFTDFGACPERSGSAAAGVMHRVERTAFATGAMPHFEMPDAFEAAYERFLSGQRLRVEPARRAAPRSTFNPLQSELRHER